MELQQFITNHTDNFIHEFKKKNVYVHKYTELELVILKLKRNVNYDFQQHPWLRYCRGAVVHLGTKRLVCIPPLKADREVDIHALDDYSETMVFQPLIDGTMINMFYHKDKWMISTRSGIGGKNSWDGKIPFLTMFHDVNGDKWYDELDPGNCYSFVLQHKKNRIVCPVDENALYLVESYTMGDTIEKVHSLPKISNIQTIENISKEELKYYENPDLYFSIKGITCKTDTTRINWINPNYEYVKGLKMNHNNRFMNYISLKQKDQLSKYLVFFPEDRYEFDSFNEIVMNIKDLTYENYVKIFIRKGGSLKDIQYSLKPLLHEIHTIYQKDKKKITRERVNQYIDTIDGRRLLFIQKYL